MMKEKAQFFVDVELTRILDSSEGRLAKIVGGLINDSTIGEVVNSISDELIRTANNLKGAIVGFEDVKISEL